MHVGGNIIFTLQFGVIGLIVSQYLAHTLSALYSFFILKKSAFYSSIIANTTVLSREFKKEFLSYSIVSALTTFASAALTLLDVTCLDFILNDAEILADYKVALTIPAALLFVPKSFMTYYFPKLVKAFSTDQKSGIKEVVQYTAINICLNGLICTCIILFAPLLINILYGEKYMNVIPVFRILGINFFFSSLRLVSGHVISALKKVKVNLVFTIFSGIANIGINILLIPIFGSIGAAMATLTVSIGMLLANIFYLGLYFKKTQTTT